MEDPPDFYKFVEAGCTLPGEARVMRPLLNTNQSCYKYHPFVLIVAVDIGLTSK